MSIKCSECGGKLVSPGEDSQGMICEHDGFEPSIDEQIALMKRARERKEAKKGEK